MTFEAHSTGTLLIAVLIDSSVFYMAIPLGLIGKVHYGHERDGHTASDIPALFRRHDDVGRGELDLEEFKQLLAVLRRTLRHEQSVTIFEAIFETIFEATGTSISASTFAGPLSSGLSRRLPLEGGADARAVGPDPM